MIKIINGVYGHYIDGRVVAKNCNSDPFELTAEQEARLVERNVAAYVSAPNIVTKEVTLDEVLHSMKVSELRDMGKKAGMTFKVGMLKDDMISAIASKAAETDAGHDAEEDDEPPAFNAAEAVQ